jgi:hypothetical protein
MPARIFKAGGARLNSLVKKSLPQVGKKSVAEATLNQKGIFREAEASRSLRAPNEGFFTKL